MDSENKFGLFECHQNLLHLMATFDKMCQENRIIYGADSGTLLGAIRHDGFIPWDDDLDVVVDRANYDKLMMVNLGEYKLRYVRKDFVESLCFSDDIEMTTKPILDIFVLDNTPDSRIARRIKIAKILMVHGLWHRYTKQKYSSRSLGKRVYSFIFKNLGRFYTEEQIFRKFQNISKKDNNNKTEYVQCFNYLTHELHVLYPHDILKNVMRHKFEDIEITVPQKYDLYLSSLYGDWKTPKKTK